MSNRCKGAEGREPKHLEDLVEESSVAIEMGGDSEDEFDSPKRKHKGRKHFNMDDGHDRHHSHGMKGY